MKRLLISLTLLMISNSIYSQVNLVPNPSFEERDSCPNSFVAIRCAKNWCAYVGSVDYFHKCSPSNNWSVPSNFAGFQNPKDVNDSAYAGIVVKTLAGYSEIFGCRLISPLIIGRKYYFSFLTSNGYTETQYFPQNLVCYSDKLGMKLTTSYLDSFPAINYFLIDNQATLFSDTIIADTSNWSTFNGTFVADSAYTTLLIGNFFQPGNINWGCWSSSTLKFAYYYIDNVCLSADSNFCYQLKSVSPISSIFPILGNNYSTNELTIDFPHVISKLSIYDLVGRLIFAEEFNSYMIINYSAWSAGVYIISINNEGYKFHILK